MPLFTYVVTFKGASHVAQGSHSNFTGFVSTWAAGIPEGALPGLTPALRKELANKAYQGTFAPIPNVKHVWHKVIEVGGSPVSVVAVQTQQ
jgi:hypothetical protein